MIDHIAVHGLAHPLGHRRRPRNLQEIPPLAHRHSKLSPQLVKKRQSDAHTFINEFIFGASGRRLRIAIDLTAPKE
jgi:hypothetical protein